MISKILNAIGIFLVVVTSISALSYLFARPQQNITWGINYSSVRAVDLGYDPQQLFRTILTDLKPKKVRLPAYWEEIEPTKGQYNFTMIDTLLSEAEKAGAEVIVVVGHKQPRWPECHHPGWWKDLSKPEQDQALLEMVKQTVNHLKDNKTVTAWQVENEPFFEYGQDCETLSYDFYKKEIDTLREIDNTRPIIGTDSGEKGAWLPTAWAGVDILGATMYREIYHDKKGEYLTYPIPPLLYNVKAGLVRILSGANQTIGVELQAEPWYAGSDAWHTAKEEQQRLMNPEKFFENVDYASQVGFSENYLWGVEWWYWMQKHHNDNSMIDAAKKLFGS